VKKEVSVFWFRRDLRLDDNTGLYQALVSGVPVLPIFIFDTEILKELPRDDARVSFIHRLLGKMRKFLQEQYGTSLALFHGNPREVFQSLLEEWKIKAVYTNRDYEPYARKRDGELKSLLENHGIPLFSFKDQVIYEKSEVVKGDGDPYVVYTPYMKKWKEVFAEQGPPESVPSESKLEHLLPAEDLPYLSLQDMGFEKSGISVPDYNLEKSLIANYEQTRNIPSMDGTSHLGPHLRFGTLSIRKALQQARKAENETFWNELIWREFFMQILWHFPHTVKEAFKKKYDRIRWRNREEEFECWKQGKTGYALVDAGMRQLNQTGYMHNRVRMLVASFLCKHLLIDWRWGEAYFAEKLLDYELSSNVGNWQWAAGSGVDAAPYFRIFNPMTQVDKFDKDRAYIRKWVPELGTDAYPDKMVDHKQARERCLEVYKEALDG
jgi:deoxyribodipyrimidine photo-lyase